jgi:UDP-N-acetylglucosamine--N-acetylmuramyl-(pentapeptide) pyrophosphoryl-undecaprenol N-acetylglucosamine transferase
VPRPIVIAAGGTGGHIFPGLALADALHRHAPNTPVSFIGTPRGLEQSIIPRRGYSLHLVDMKPLVRRFGPGPFLAAASLVRATVQARKILRAQRVGAVVGMGGYPSLPVIAAARWLRIPSMLHESGAVPGLANRIAARLTHHVALAFDEAARFFPRSVRSRTVGMPLDPSISGIDRDSLRREARTVFDLPTDVRVLLVMGGSLGAMRLNEIGVDLASRWRDRAEVRLLMKTGAAHLRSVQAELDRRGVSHVVRCVAFFDRMDLAYAAADLALSRSGAGSVAELCSGGLPSILVPYPHAPRDHQTANAGPLARSGGAVIVPDAEADVARVGPSAAEPRGDEERWRRMAAGLKGLARPEAADDLARWALELASVARV